MQLHGPASFILFGALTVACAKDPRQAYEKQPAPNFLFWEHPFHFNCTERPPKPVPPAGSAGVGGWVTSEVFGPGGSKGQATYMLSRIDSLSLPKANAPTLTLVTEPANILDISIQAADEDNWKLRFCAQGEGDSEDEARGYLNNVSMRRVGGTITLAGGGFDRRPESRHYLVGGRGNLIVDAPHNAPMTIHNTYGPISVHDMDGPLRLTAALGRVSVLNTTGTVDADGFLIDFAGSKGMVTLNATGEININITDVQFQGALSAHASRAVRVLVPKGFQGPLEALVAEPKNLICRADFCAKMQKSRVNGWYSFTYMKDVGVPPGRIGLQSELSNVVIDNAP
jgi:hypothetical protein